MITIENSEENVRLPNKENFKITFDDTTKKYRAEAKWDSVAVGDGETITEALESWRANVMKALFIESYVMTQQIKMSYLEETEHI